MNKTKFLEKCKLEKDIKWDGESDLIQIKNRMVKISLFIKEDKTYDWEEILSQLKHNRKVIA